MALVLARVFAMSSWIMSVLILNKPAKTTMAMAVLAGAILTF